jgi:Ca-activated chloride channel family protein
MSRLPVIAAAALAALTLSAQYRPRVPRPLEAAAAPTEGSLYRLDSEGRPAAICPLKHTAVKARITGYLARVDVTQEFVNPDSRNIEAVYKFPLPPMSAVDRMTMQVGDRTIAGRIKLRDEARAIFEAARAAGHTAGLLDQERPNIFTQSVTNIAPGATVRITLSYVETVPYDGGTYSFTFPTVVGPRYIPRDWQQRVPDAPNIVPLRTPEGTRAGHDLSIEVALDAGIPVSDISSTTHAVDVARPAPPRATVKLRDEAVIPNKDFVLRYRVTGQKIEDAVLTHNGARGGFFTLMLQPPARVAPADATPKEIVFVLDTSGSMMGFPIDKAKESMKAAIDSLNPRDTFNLITFSGDTHILFPQPVTATPENLRKAQDFLASRSGSGGTEMMKAIRAALDPSGRQDHVRVVCFMTDGEVGNDMEIISEVQKHPNARIFAFGIGSSVNHFLLDNMARYGRGEVEYVALNDDGDAAARRFHERVQSPLLTDISIDWGGLNVSETFPKRIPDLFSAKPVMVTGRYSGAARGVIHLRGKMGGRDFDRAIPVSLPGSEPRNDVLAATWARAKVEDLMSQDWMGIQRNAPSGDLRRSIEQLGLDYNLMTQYTSFVAVEETTIVEGGKPRRIEVPVEMPEGVSYEGIYGREEARDAMPMRVFASAAPAAQVTGFAGPRAKTLRLAERIDMAPPIPASKIAPKLDALRTGKVTVQIWLADTSAATIAKLKAQGVEILAQPKSGRLVVARLAVEKLQAIAAVKEVKYIAPAS